MYAGAQEKVRRVVLGYNLAGVGPVVAEVERVGELDADPGESGACRGAIVWLSAADGSSSSCPPRM